MRMLSLLLRLRTTTGRAGDIDTVLGHDREPGQSELHGLLGILLRSLLGHARIASSVWRGHARRGISGVAKRRRGAGRRRVDRAESRGLRLRWALPEHARGEGDIVAAHERAIAEVDGRAVIEINGHLGELVLLGSRASDVSIDQRLQLLRTKSRLELQRGTQERLGDGERGDSGRGGSHYNELRGDLGRIGYYL